jgi:hypothetical protein
MKTSIFVRIHGVVPWGVMRIDVKVLNISNPDPKSWA